MKVTIGAEGFLVFVDIFNPIVIETPAGRFGVCQRDGGLEVVLDGRIVFHLYEWEKAKPAGVWNMKEDRIMSNVPKEVQELASSVGGTITDGGRCPDGSGWAMMTMELPKDHWLYDETDRHRPPMPFRMGTDDPRRRAFVDAIRAIGRYAVRASTMCGKEMDFDPDAMLQNLVVGAVGYWTQDGLTDDEWANPNPIPPIWAAEVDADLKAK